MKDYTIIGNFLSVVSDVPFWYDQTIHRRVCEILSDPKMGKLHACKFLVDKSKEFGTRSVFNRSQQGKDFGLKWAKESIVDQLSLHTKHSIDLEKRDKMREVLQKLIDAFPEMDTDEPINGSDAVDVLCQLWPEIKEAVKE